MWIQYDRENLRSVLSAAELKALPNASKQANIEPEVLLDEAVESARRKVLSKVRKRNTLGVRGTIPDECKDAMLALAREVIFGRLPGIEFLNTPTRKEQLRNEKKLLDDIAAGDADIEPPVETGDELGGEGGIVTVSRRKNKFGGNPALKGM